MSSAPKIFRRIQENMQRPRFKATVKMKEPFTATFVKKPTKDNVLEAFADEILSGQMDKIFEITIKEVRNALSLKVKKPNFKSYSKRS